MIAISFCFASLLYTDLNEWRTMFYSGFFKNHILETTIVVSTVAVASLVTIQLYFRKPKKITRIIDMMDILHKSSVHIKNRDHVEEVVSQLIKGSASKLQVISDFDQTITRTHKNGQNCTTSYGILEQPLFVSESYRNKTATLYAHYHPIEVDPNLTKAQKVPLMIEWYTKNLTLMPTSGITKESLSEMISASNCYLREGCESVFESLYKHNVPLLVFSAGVGDVLKEVLRRNDVLFPNVKIIANFLQFDEKNNLAGFKNDLIHTFNKNVSSLENEDYFNHLKARNNIILLGDSLGDLDMAEGVKDVNAILKIGFLNFKIEENLPEYMNCYDIVLTDDQTMEVVVGLLQSIL